MHAGFYSVLDPSEAGSDSSACTRCALRRYLDEYDKLPPGIQLTYASPWGPGWSSGLSAEDAALVAPLRPTPPPEGTVPADGFRGPVLEHLIEPTSRSRL